MIKMNELLDTDLIVLKKLAMLSGLGLSFENFLSRCIEIVGQAVNVEKCCIYKFNNNYSNLEEICVWTIDGSIDHTESYLLLQSEDIKWINQKF